MLTPKLPTGFFAASTYLKMCRHYRIYIAQEGKQLIVLFGGGTKKTQQADIDRAKELYEEYKKRKKEASEEKGKESKKKR